MRQYVKRSMIIKSSRIRFLEKWARNLPTRDPEEVEHAVRVFAQARFTASEKTARKYAKRVLELLGLTEEEDNASVFTLLHYSASNRKESITK